MKFRKYIIIFVSLIVLIITPLIAEAAPSNNPIFATIQTVQQMIANALSSIQDTLGSHTGRIERLESDVADLQQRVYTLEHPPTPTPTPTPAIGLQDDFNGNAVNTDLWEVFANNGAYSESNGYINIPGGNVPGMPFFRAKNNPFPTSGSFTIEFGIQYTTIYPAGDGLALSEGQQPNNSTGPNINPLSIWQSNGSDGLLIARYGVVVAIVGHNDLDYHIVKFIYDGDKYSVYLDGTLKYTSPSTPRASGLWFGHPYYSDLPGWTGFRLDYIKVTTP